jgi:di- and tripeptidase
MTALPQHDGTPESNGAEKPVSKTPVLAHRMKHDKSILALAVSAQYLFAGTQDGEILVCGDSTMRRCGLNLAGLQPRHVRAAESHPRTQRQRARVLPVAGPEAALLQCDRSDRQCRHLYKKGKRRALTWQVWCTSTFRHLYALWSPYDIGDIFCVAYSSHHRTIYLGAQNTSIQVWRSRAR